MDSRSGYEGQQNLYIKQNCLLRKWLMKTNDFSGMVVDYRSAGFFGSDIPPCT